MRRKLRYKVTIRGKASPQAVLHADGWRGYDGLVDLGFDKHFRVSHGESEFSSGANHINGIESGYLGGYRSLVLKI